MSRLAKTLAMQLTSLTRLLTNARNTKRRKVLEITNVIPMLVHLTKVKSKAKPVRLRDCYPEPHRQNPADGTAATTAMPTDRDKEGTQFVSMAPDG